MSFASDPQAEVARIRAIVKPRNAMSALEERYGGMEEFVATISYDPEYKNVMNEDLPLFRRAELAGFSLTEFMVIIGSPEFKVLRRKELLNLRWTDNREAKHIEHMIDVAENKPRKTTTQTGKIVEVDHSPADIIASGKYLAELRGTPVDKSQQQVRGGVTIIIENHNGRGSLDAAQTIDIDMEDYHRPQIAGGAPPPGILERTQRPALLVGDRSAAGAEGDVGAFYGRRASEEEEAQEIARRAARSGGDVDVQTIGRGSGRPIRRQGDPPVGVHHITPAERAGARASAIEFERDD